MKLTLALILSVLIGVSGLSADLADGLLAHYPFSGSADDASGNACHGSVNGATLTADRYGTAEAAYQFDGFNDHIIVADSVPLRLADTDFSISIWAFETERNAGYQDALLVKRGSGQADGWFFSLTGIQSAGSIGVGKVYYQVSGGTNPNFYSPMAIPLETWTHLIITYNVTEHIARFYVNGDLAAVSGYIPSPNPVSAASLYIGSDSQGAGYYFHGKIDDVRIYNRLLTQGEIYNLAGIVADLTAPQDLAVTRSDGTVHLSWDPVPMATDYSVFSSDDPSLAYGSWNLEASGLVTPNWNGTTGADKRFFFVRAYR